MINKTNKNPFHNFERDFYSSFNFSGLPEEVKGPVH